MPTTTLPRPLQHQALVSALVFVLSLLCWLMPAGAVAHAESLNPKATTEYQELSAELNQLLNQEAALSPAQEQRLADLQRLEAAVASAEDRATVINASTHNLGLFARYKKQPSDQPASFFILGPGHETDDDYAVVALYLPAQVGLSWPGGSGQSAAASARVVSLLPGEALEVSDGADTASLENSSYQLSLPAYEVESQNSQLAAVPELSQEDLDGQAETAPLD